MQVPRRSDGVYLGTISTHFYLTQKYNATLGCMAGQFPKVAAVLTAKAFEKMKLTKQQIAITMFGLGLDLWEI